MSWTILLSCMMVMIPVYLLVVSNQNGQIEFQNNSQTKCKAMVIYL